MHCCFVVLANAVVVVGDWKFYRKKNQTQYRQQHLQQSQTGVIFLNQQETAEKTQLKPSKARRPCMKRAIYRYLNRTPAVVKCFLEDYRTALGTQVNLESG